MSEGQPEAIELPPQADAAFSSLMDLLVASEPGATPEAGAAAADAAAAGGPDAGAAGAGAGDQAAAGTGAAAGAVGADGTLQLPTAGDQPEPGAGANAAGDASAGTGAAGGSAATGGTDALGGGATGIPVGWTVEAASVAPQLAELSTKLEEKVAADFQQAALEEVRGEHGNYFDALEKHPRLLVGTQVPAIGKEGFESIRDTADAREWQDAVKGLLVEEIRDRAGRAMEADSGVLNTLHASIELFQNNADLLPGTKGFDVDLANRFAAMVKPYEHRVDGKLHGYSIPVQPIIDQLRAQVRSERAAAPVPPGTPAGGAAAPKPAKPAAEPPQAGIASQAGSSGDDKEEFSTLFGTIGLPNLRI